MKKIILILAFCLFCISSRGFCDVTYNAKSTVSQDNKQDIIKMDVIPIIDVMPARNNKRISDTPIYVAPLISPAREKDPTLNFNLNNIKNIKKGAILPDDNVNKSITSVVQYFNSPYDKVFSHLLGVVNASDFELVSYDSEKGRIFANYKSEKPIYITVSRYNSTNVMVKITPADGIYDLPATVTNKIFSDLNRSLATK